MVPIDRSQWASPTTCYPSATLHQTFNSGVDRHKKEPPGSPRSRGFCRLLPQLVGSCDPGGGVSGDGNAARVGLSILIYTPVFPTCRLNMG
jgi:hypothetical protein